MIIKNIPIDQLENNEGQIPYVNQNPRDLTNDGFDLVVRSIQDFPEMLEAGELVVYPYILVDPDNYKQLAARASDISSKIHVDDRFIVIGGNQRLRALRELGYTEAPCKIVEWTTEQINEFIIKDNLSYGNWDWSLIANEWDTEQLVDWGMDIPVTDVIEELIDSLTDEDIVPDLPEDPVTKLGDIWLLGNHRLMCGDSTMIDDVEKLMGGKLADMVFTDPPYGVKYSARTSKLSGKIRPQMQMILNDDLNPNELTDFLTDVFANLIIVSKDNAPFYICNNWHCTQIFLQAFFECDLTLNAWIIWHKEWMSLGHGHYRNNHEFIFYSQRNGDSYAQKGTQQDVWSVQKLSPANKIHTTEKPVELIEKSIINSSKNNDLVLDLFGGSGSTLIACHKNNRINYSMELDPKYCDVIIKRWQYFTGKNAMLESTKENFNDAGN